MVLLKAIWGKEADGSVSPTVIYYVLRAVMFTLGFVLEDWAIYELVRSPRRRNESVILVASSYVTWTFQTHTFSNSVETLLVLWSLVLMQRIADNGSPIISSKTDSDITSWQKRSSLTSSAILGFLLVAGVFNRITFPAFVLIPGLQLLPHFWDRYAQLILIISRFR